jgi:preprotein translocase subunit SecF
VKSLLKLFVLLVVVTAAVGYFKGWYSFSVETDANGHKVIKTDVDTQKMSQDLEVVTAKSRDLLSRIGDKLKSLKDKSAKSSGEQKTKIDVTIQDLERRRDQLQADLDRLNQETGAKAAEQRKSIEKQLDELDDALQKALSGH